MVVTDVFAVGVALEVCPRGVDVDPLSGEPAADSAPLVMSAAAEAALETGLTLAERWGGTLVVATVGPPEVDQALRDAVAAGAHRAVRVEAPARALPGSAESVRAVSTGLATALGGCGLVVCGDYGMVGGSAAVPALIAAELDAAQALGLVSVRPGDQPGVVLAERRLDGGRRERLRLAFPAVISVEPGVARLRRAPLPRVLAARTHPIESLGLARRLDEPAASLAPYRPRARALSGPQPGAAPGDRIRSLLGVNASQQREPPRVVRSPPQEAAREILEHLRRWGYVR